MSVVEKPRAGDKILFDYLLLGKREATWYGTVLEWPRYGRVKVSVDLVRFDPKGYFKVGDVASWDEYTAAMYLGNGCVKKEEWRGVYPGMCHDPEICRGYGHCPRDRSCCE